MKNLFKIYGTLISLILLHLFLTLLYAIGALVYFIILHGSEIGFDSFINGQLTNMTIFSGLASVLIYVLFFLIRKKNLFTYVRFRKITWRQSAVSVCIGSSFLFFSVIVVDIIARWFPAQYTSYAETINMMEQSGMISLFLAVVIVAPFFEEILFRGVAFQLLSQRHRLVTAAIISGVLFGMYHQNIFQGTFASLLGILLGLSLIWTRSIWAPLLIHFVNNLLSLLLGYGVLSNGFVDSQVLLLVLTIFMVLIVLPLSIYGLYRLRSHEPFNRNQVGDT